MSQSPLLISREPRLAARRWDSAFHRWLLVMVGVSVVAFGHYAPAGEPTATQPDTVPPAVVLELARNDIANGRVDLARERLTLLLQRQPDHEEARKALAELGLANQSPVHQRAGQGNELTSELRLADGRRLLARGEEELKRGNLEEAVLRFEQAEAVLGQGDLAPGFAELQQKVEERITQTRQQIIDGHSLNRDQARRVAEITTAEFMAQGRLRLRERLQRVMDLERRKLLQLALSECRVLLRDYPESATVRTLYRRLIDASHDLRELDLEERHNEIHQELQEQLSRSVIPYGFGTGPLFPNDWRERHAQSDALLDQPQELDAADELMRERLLIRTTIDVEAQDAVQVLMALGAQAKLNLIIAPEVSTAGKQVTLKAKNITIESALSWICRMIDTTWNQGNGGVYVGSDANEVPVTALYNISDVLFQPPDQYPMWRLGVVPNDGADGSLLAPPVPGDQPAGIAPEDLVDDLTQAISPATWTRDDCSIEIFRYNLLITAPPRVHLLVREFIRAMTQRSRLMVAVDARWVTIADGYLEEIGVEWTTTNSLLTLPGAGTAGFRRQTSQFDHRGELINNLPAPAIDVSPVTDGTGLSLSGILLDAFQLSAVLTAVERNRRSNVVEGSELVTFNGVRAYSTFERQLAYIGGYDVGAGGGNGLGALPEPRVNILRLGAMLEVRPLVSSDRKYVKMEIGSTLTRLVAFNSETLQSNRAQPVGFDPNANNGQGGTIVNNQTLTNTLEMPVVNYTELRTYIQVPDGGTILVGGWGRYIEQSMSTKIPFLGHIPFLGRLFGQRGRYSDREKINLLVTVNIIDYEELEELQ